MKAVINVTEFMELTPEKKKKYCLIDEDGNLFDCEECNFAEDVPEDRYVSEWECERCEKDLVVGFGTTDGREPYFCRECFILINEKTSFVIWSVAKLFEEWLQKQSSRG